MRSTRRPASRQERPLARAKRTDRAEARRRYRAAMPAPRGSRTSVDAESRVRRAAPTRRRRGTADVEPCRPDRASGAAFRQSIHPVNVRDDLAAPARGCVTTPRRSGCRSSSRSQRHRRVAITTGPTTSSPRLMFAYFVQTPAIGGVFIAGFLAPRASWLLGLIVGLVSAVCYSVDHPRWRSSARPSRRPARDVIVAGVPALADLRRAVRLRRGVVSPVPAAVEPEPRPARARRRAAARGDGRSRPRQPPKARTR